MRRDILENSLRKLIKVWIAAKCFELCGLCDIDQFHELDFAKQNLIGTAINFPGIDNKSICDGSVIIRTDMPKQIAIRIEMQDACFRESTCRRNAVLHSSDGPPRTPDIVHDQCGTSAQLVFRRELNKLGPHHELGLLGLHLRGEVHSCGEDMCDIHRLS